MINATLFDFNLISEICRETISHSELDFRNEILGQSNAHRRWCIRSAEQFSDEYIAEMRSLVGIVPTGKRYIVQWQTPGLKGCKNIGCEDFGKIGEIILKTMNDSWPDMKFIITKIELIEPEQYLK